MVAVLPPHTNPVYGSYFADPFVWKYQDTYYAIGTGQLEATGRTVNGIFPILRSPDLITWQPLGSALVRPDPRLGGHFWAPSVAFFDGHFFLYYSVGHEDKRHHLRVAISDSPQGPYFDSGKPLLDPATCSFAIDPHPFQDEDGQWYLFYAKDFLDTAASTRAGTALAAARMTGMTGLEPHEAVVLRAHSDWQRFQSPRLMYGGIWDWHTLEGPCVCKFSGQYYCFYSGGRWETENYGVDYGIAGNVLGPYSDAGNELGPRVLRTVPGQLIGPGHNSIITGPDGRTEYLVYHAWNQEMTSRQMHIAPLDWTPAGPRLAG